MSFFMFVPLFGSGFLLATPCVLLAKQKSLDSQLVLRDWARVSMKKWNIESAVRSFSLKIELQSSYIIQCIKVSTENGIPKWRTSGARDATAASAAWEYVFHLLHSLSQVFRRSALRIRVVFEKTKIGSIFQHRSSYCWKFSQFSFTRANWSLMLSANYTR